MNKNNIISIVIIVIALAVSSWFVFFGDNSSNNNGSQGQVLVEVKNKQKIATINGEDVLGEYFQKIQSQIVSQQGIDVSTLSPEIKDQLKDQIIDILISQVLISQKTKELNITVSEDELNQELESIKQQFGTEEDFQNLLSGQNLSEESLKENIFDGLLAEKYFEQELNLSQLTVTEEEVQELYNQALESGQEIPALEEVYQQVEQTVLMQKQQELIFELLENIKNQSEIEIFI